MRAGRATGLLLSLLSSPSADCHQSPRATARVSGPTNGICPRIEGGTPPSATLTHLALPIRLSLGAQFRAASGITRWTAPAAVPLPCRDQIGSGDRQWVT